MNFQIKYNLHPPYFKVPEESTFPDAWEVFCCIMLNTHNKTDNIHRRKPPEKGIDLLWREKKIAYQCKSVFDENGKFNITNAKKSLKDAIQAKQEDASLDWHTYEICTNIELTGSQESKLTSIETNIEIREKTFWWRLCDI